MLSVVIPCFNEREFIVNTLNTLVNKLDEVEIDFEVIVVDNKSIDETSALVEGVINARPLNNIRLLSLHERVTISKARNKGVEVCFGNVIAFIDADVLVTTYWADRVKWVIENGVPNTLTGAQYDVSLSPSWLENHWFRLMHMREPNYINGGNIIIEKNTFLSIGGFDEFLQTGEDVSFSKSAKSKGFQVVNEPKFKVHHEGYPKTLLNFFKRELWHGKGDYQSCHHFLSSKTAIVSMIFLVLNVFMFASVLLQNAPAAIVAATIVVSLCFASILYKYGPALSLGSLLVSTYIMYVYFWARSLAFLSRR